MKKVLLAVAVVLMILAGVVVAGAWYITRPMRFDGVDRDADHMTTTAPLVDAERPGVTRRELIELLQARNFDLLTRIIETRAQRAMADPKEEAELTRVVDAFGNSDDSISRTIDDWVQASPNSYAPVLASAQHRFALAFYARGTRIARETSREQFAGMNEQLRLALEDLRIVIEKEPRLSEAYALLIDILRAGGTQIACGQAAKAGLDAVPASYSIRAALAACRLPRWGGSYERVQAIADRAAPFVVDNPRLAALAGIAEWDRGRMADGNEALTHFDAALAAGEHWQFYQSRAQVFSDEKNYRVALTDLEAALTLAPDHPDLLISKMYALVGLDRADETDAIVEIVEVIDPLNTDLKPFREFAAKYAAYRREVNVFEAGKSGSIQKLSEDLAANGANADTYYWRGRAFLKSNDEGNALLDFQKAVQLDPAHFESVRNIDYILARRGQWDSVISQWNNYLAMRPDDGNAYYERAGTHRHAGNAEKSVEDLKKACELGIVPACDRVPRQAGR